MVVLWKELGGLSLGGMWGRKVMIPIRINSYNAGKLPEAHWEKKKPRILEKGDGPSPILGW